MKHHSTSTKLRSQMMNGMLSLTETKKYSFTTLVFVLEVIILKLYLFLFIKIINQQ